MPAIQAEVKVKAKKSQDVIYDNVGDSTTFDLKTCEAIQYYDVHQLRELFCEVHAKYHLAERILEEVCKSYSCKKILGLILFTVANPPSKVRSEQPF